MVRTMLAIVGGVRGQMILRLQTLKLALVLRTGQLRFRANDFLNLLQHLSMVLVCQLLNVKPLKRLPSNYCCHLAQMEVADFLALVGAMLMVKATNMCLHTGA